MGLLDDCRARVGAICSHLCPGATELASYESGEEKGVCVYGARVAMPGESQEEREYKGVVFWAFQSSSSEAFVISGGRFHKTVKIDRVLHTSESSEGYFVFDDVEPFECFVFELGGQRVGFVYRATDVPVISPGQARGVLDGNIVLGEDDSSIGSVNDFSSKQPIEVRLMDSRRYARWYQTYVHKASTFFKEEIEEAYQITGSYNFWVFGRNRDDSPDLPTDYRARYPLVIFIAFIEEDDLIRVVFRLTHSGKSFSCLRYDTGGSRTMLFDTTDGQGDVLDEGDTDFRNYVFSFDEGEHTFSADEPIVFGLDRQAIKDKDAEANRIDELAKHYADTDEETALVQKWREEFSKTFDGLELDEKVRQTLNRYRRDQLRKSIHGK